MLNYKSGRAGRPVGLKNLAKENCMIQSTNVELTSAPLNLGGTTWEPIWPSDAQYRVDFSSSTSPKGEIKFFSDAFGLRNWYQENVRQHVGTTPFIVHHLWTWDFGPCLVEDIAPHVL